MAPIDVSNLSVDVNVLADPGARIVWVSQKTMRLIATSIVIDLEDIDPEGSLQESAVVAVTIAELAVNSCSSGFAGAYRHYPWSGPQ